MSDNGAIPVDLLQHVQGPSRIVFANGDALDVPKGSWYTTAFGMVVEDVATSPQVIRSERRVAIEASGPRFRERTGR